MMDFPQAWAFVRDTKPEQHDPECSWRRYNGGFLCDCHVLSDEYNRRLSTSEQCRCGCDYPDTDKAMSLHDFAEKYIKPQAAQMEKEIRAIYECPSCHSSDRAIRLSLGQAYHEGKDMCLDGWHFSKEWPNCPEPQNLDERSYHVDGCDCMECRTPNS
jgi:hypothetical protein